MDRLIVYPGAIPLDTDMLYTNQFGMFGLAKLAEAVLGTSTIVSGLAVTPTAPASLNVYVGEGQIYKLAALEPSIYSTLPQDLAHQVMKQGVLKDAVQLACPAPGTAGFSVDYVIQAAFAETDADPELLPYYNSSNPSQPYSGPNNSGLPQNTKREGRCNVSVKAGVAAATGSQVTPTPDTGQIGLFVITVANGQTAINTGDIRAYTGAARIPSGGMIGAINNGLLSKSVAGNSNVTLTAAEAAYPMIVLTGTLTGNINVNVPNATGKWVVANLTSGTYTVTFQPTGGAGVAIPQGQAATAFCDGAGTIRLAGSGGTTFFNVVERTYAGSTTFNVTYTPGSLLVVKNGSVLEPGDFTATTGTTVVVASATTGDKLQFYVYQAFSVANAYTKAEVDTLVAQATESTLGRVEIATQAETDAGSDDARAVTPKKLRWGFGVSLGTNGYIKFPTWMSGLVIQWGENTASPAGNTHSFPTAFPTAGFVIVVGNNYSAGVDTNQGGSIISTTQFQISRQGASATVPWIAVGH